MRPVVIFAGTVEGRTLSEYLSEKGVPVTACVATEYGEALLEENGSLTVHTGRMDEKQMEDFLREQNPELVVDATHPYAVEVSRNLSAACQKAQTEYLRLVRETAEAEEGQAVRVGSLDEAVEYLKQTDGNILATTGSKELAKYTAIPGYEKRVFARVLSTAEVAASCGKLGFQGRNLICMQGPFSEELNTAMLRQFECKYLVTKETGKAGGFEEKLCAAKKAGAQVVLVGRPAEQKGYSYTEVEEMLTLRFRLPAPERKRRLPEENSAKRRRVTLIGVGMGTPKGMTVEAAKAVDEADVLIGASYRILKAANTSGKPTFTAYEPEKIADYIALNSQYAQVAVLLSGDLGFYSGAKKLYDAMEGYNYEIVSLCGISSVVYFCGKLHTAWEDVCLLSLHGRKANLTGAVRTHRKTFALLSSRGSVKELCQELLEYGLSEVQVHVGERLGYPEEKITCGAPKELLEGEYDGLCVALIENEKADSAVPSCLADEEFLRGKAPMTKSEVRSLSVAKLRLPKDAVVFDVGAGTGSVSVEMALQALEGTVYAIERDKEACRLIEQNKRKFGTPHIKVVNGLAPRILEDLPAPTHAFIGGSAGNLKEILRTLLAKNPSLRIVANTVTLETMGEVMECIRELPLVEEEMISVSVARAKKAGKYHLMTGQNPIYIITLRGGRDT